MKGFSGESGERVQNGRERRDARARVRFGSSPEGGERGGRRAPHAHVAAGAPKRQQLLARGGPLLSLVEGVRLVEQLRRLRVGFAARRFADRVRSRRVARPAAAVGRALRDLLRE
eukprot:3008531-Prymnesium_polylepis.1